MAFSLSLHVCCSHINDKDDIMLCETLAAVHYSSRLFLTVTQCLPAGPNRRGSVKDSLNCLISIILHIMTAGNR